MNLTNDKLFFLKKIISYLVPYRITQQKGKNTDSLEVSLESGQLVLNTKKVNYSFGSLHHIFKNTFHHIKLSQRKISKALILGFGVGDVALQIKKNCGNCEIVGVEIDEAVIELGKKYFNTEKIKKLSLHCADAYDFMLNHNDCYDLIVVDLFIDDITPLKFSEKKFVAAIQKNLAENGLVCFNRFVNTEKNMSDTNALIHSITEVFKQYTIKEMKLNGVTNWMVICNRN